MNGPPIATTPKRSSKSIAPSIVFGTDLTSAEA